MELHIEKLIYGGDGLARLPADERGRGKAVFLPFVLEGERVDASIVEQKPGFARGRVEQILESSLKRIEPPCPYFGRCGGCHYQHTGYEHQLEIKTAILKENLQRIAKLQSFPEVQVHASPPWNYRNRTRMRVQAQPQFALGYYKFGTHELLPVEECPISSPLINRAIASVWQLGRAGRLDARVREIEFFANADDSELLVELYVAGEEQPHRHSSLRASHSDAPLPTCHSGQTEGSAFPKSVAKRAPAWIDVAKGLHAVIPNAIGCAVFLHFSRETDSKTSPPLAISGAGALNYKTARASYRVSAGAFFQVNRFLTDALIEMVTQNRSGAVTLDLYAGVGLFSTVLSREFREVIAVESSQQSSADLAYNVPGNVKAVRARVEDYLKTTRGQLDLVVVDPPRGGLGQLVARSLAELRAPAMTYVSCDPATLARDLVVLLAAGYRVEQAHLVDLFPQTFHLETVLHLAR